MSTFQGSNDRLALLGGRAVTTDNWPVWPHIGQHSLEFITNVAHSSMWAISGRRAISEPGRSEFLQCQKFCTEFASFLGRRWCVETDHGTSALITAFEALNLGPGDEVIVPVLTWVACATAVLQVGATPILVDVDPDTLCLDPQAVAAAVTERTRCILAVHLHCTAADIRALSEIAQQHHLFLVEDCAQAHGARWSDGRLLGSDGVLTIFSMQQSKVLTAGEGGAVVGDDEMLRQRVEWARADGRELRRDIAAPGEMSLLETGQFTGANYCLSEFAAALLRDGLKRLPNEVERRSANASLLDRELNELGIRVITAHPDLSVRPVYEYGIYLDPEVFGNIPVDLLRSALGAELRLPVYATDAPLHLSPLFRPETKKRFGLSREHYFGSSSGYPVAEAAYQRLAMIHHGTFLAQPTNCATSC